MKIWLQIIRLAFIGGLIMMVIALPVFNVGLSIATMWLSGTWITALITDIAIGVDRFRLLRKLRENKIAVALIAIYLIHVVGLFYSQDMGYALHDLKAKLPLFVIPFVLTGCPEPSEFEKNLVLNFFLSSLLFSVACSLVVYYGVVEAVYTDVREITHAFITRVSHLRLGILVALGICASWYLSKKRSKFLYLPIIAIFLYFLWIIQSMTGYIVLLGAIFVWNAIRFLTHKNRQRRVAAGTAIILVPLLLFGLIYIGFEKYYDYEPFDITTADTHTPRGEPYFHDLNNSHVENGHLVWTYVAWKELEQSWTERSELGFKESDGRGHPVYGTLIRYLTSKGLRKDADGMEALSVEDIRLIESGVASISDSQTSGLLGRVKRLFVEFDVYRSQGNPGGNSLLQRFDYWKAAKHVIYQNPMIGVGTGDVNTAMQNAYEDIGSRLEPEYRLRAHNQYLTFGVAFGITGLLLFLFIVLFILRNVDWRRNYLFICFLSMALLSFITEDTLETQTGVTFFAFFAMLFGSILFRKRTQKEI